MTISFVSAASAAATSVSIGSHQAGDLIVIIGYRDATSALSTFPNHWNLAASSIGSSNTIFVAWTEATSGGMTSGTWTGVTHMTSLVYRPASGHRLSMGLFASTGATVGSGGDITYPALAGVDTPVDRWVIGAAGHRSNDTDIQVAPSGMTNRANIAGGSTGELAVHDTDGSIGSWSNTTYTLTAGTSAAYRSVTVQVRSHAILSSGGSSTHNPFRSRAFGAAA
jgi:hypothetical protein